MENNKELYLKEIQAFRETGRQFISGEITSLQFKAVSGGMGVYAQKSQKEFMIRLRVLCGVMDYPTLQLIERFAKEYKLDKIHLTTREAVQLHDLPIEAVADIMEESLHHELYTRGGGGNFPRNVALSPLSGVDPEEAFDVTQYALAANKYFVSKMYTYKLPRKLKVGFSNTEKDSACVTVTDLGFVATKHNGSDYFKLYIGGGLGPNPAMGVPYDELIKPEEVLYHVVAVSELFAAEGDYENKAKARLRYVAKRMGDEEFIATYKKHLAKVKSEKNLMLNTAEFTRNELVNEDSTLTETNPNLFAQKQKGYYTVALHPVAGQMKTEDLSKVVEFLSDKPQTEVRLSMEECMYIRNLTAKQATELLELTQNMRQKTRLTQSISCVGTPTCQIGIGQSQSLLKSILEYFDEKEILSEDLLPTLNISGCTSSCTRQQLSSLGFQGKKKRIGDDTVEAFTLYVGGSCGLPETKFGKVYGDIKSDEIPEFLYHLALKLKEDGVEFTEYLHNKPEEFDQLAGKYLIESI